MVFFTGDTVAMVKGDVKKMTVFTVFTNHLAFI